MHSQKLNNVILADLNVLMTFSEFGKYIPSTRCRQWNMSNVLRKQVYKQINSTRIERNEIKSLLLVLYGDLLPYTFYYQFTLY